MSTDSRSRLAWRFAAPLALVACGVLLVTSAKAAGGGDLRGSGLDEMPDLVRAEERRSADLADRVVSLQEQVDQLAAAGAKVPVESPDAAALRESVGLTAVEGPGLHVTLNDAPSRPDDVDNLEAYIVHQQDLEAVINALWAGGAEAMMLMGERVVQTSSVKCIGSFLHLHGAIYPPPYTVSAIGDIESMMTALDAEPGVRDYLRFVDLVGLEYDLTVDDSMTMPAYDGPLGISQATAS